MNPREVESYLASHRQAALVVVAVVFVTAVSGFFMGLRQTRDFSAANRDARQARLASEPPSPPTGPILPAVSYSELPAAGLQANAAWTSSLASLPTQPEPREPAPVLDPAAREAALAARAARRAYDGAPPVIPHAVDQTSSAACLACHDSGTDRVIAGQRPPAISHTAFASCTQCHVPQQGPAPELRGAGPSVALSAFQGRPAPGPGSRAYPGAPPVIPHDVLLRENCLACHGAGRPNALTTSHPDRQQCTQCHLPSRTPSPAPPAANRLGLR